MQDFGAKNDVVEQITGVVAMHIKTQSALENFRVDLLRVIISTYTNFITVIEKNGEKNACVLYPDIVIKKINTILRRYSYENAPKYFKLFKHSEFENISTVIYKFLKALDNKTILSMRKSIELKKTTVNSIIESLQHQKLTL